MEYEMTGIVTLTLDHKKGSATSSHVSTNFRLEVDDQLNQSQYIDDGDLPTQEGSKVLTNILVQGLVGNIHMAHQKGFKDSAEHLRLIISELERGFAAVGIIKSGTMGH